MHQTTQNNLTDLKTSYIIGEKLLSRASDYCTQRQRLLAQNCLRIRRIWMEHIAHNCLGLGIRRIRTKNKAEVESPVHTTVNMDFGQPIHIHYVIISPPNKEIKLLSCQWPFCQLDVAKDAVFFLAFIKLFKRQKQTVGVGYTLCRRAHPFEKKIFCTTSRARRQMSE
jgi:hypothetical protein